MREAVEQAIVVAVGAASLTRARAEQIVADLVRRGQLTDEEGRVTVDALMNRVMGTGDSPDIISRIQGGVQGAMRELGIIGRDDLAAMNQRIEELEHRIRVLEGDGPDDPDAGSGTEVDPAR
ncbi:MAG: hypothetical protein EXQ74_05645 [Thermoleophilia bacterium]|nr:hypothetical protein [Thermoleophilia bacterium]